MSTLTHNMCQHLLCATTVGGYPSVVVTPPTLSFHLIWMRHPHIGGVEKVLPSCHIFEQMKWAQDMPIPTYPAVSGVLLWCTAAWVCILIPLSWFGGKHNERLRKHHCGYEASWKWDWEKWMEKRMRGQKKKKGKGKKTRVVYSCAPSLNCVISNRHESMPVDLLFLSALWTEQ